MNSRERFLATVERKPVDRPAWWFGAPTQDALPALYAHFGVRDEHGLRMAMGDDLWPVEVPYRHPPANHIACAFDFAGPQGYDKRTLTAPGFFRGITDPARVGEFPWPDPRDHMDPDKCRAAALAAPADRARMAMPWSCHFQDACAAFGMEDALVCLAQAPEMFAAVADRIVEFYLAANRIFFESAGDLLDAVLIGNDVGCQTGMLLSPEAVREFVLPGTRRLIEQAHGYGLKVIHHSCGSIRPVIGDLVAAGADAIHPIQALARGMAAEELAAEFAGRSSFCGGLDAQELLVHGRPEDVYRRTRELAELFRTGLVISPSHEAILPDMPPANIAAMRRACLEPPATGTPAIRRPMTSRERVLRALDHKPTDRAPADYGALSTVTERLVRHLGVPDAEAMLRALHVDMRRVKLDHNQPQSAPDANGFRRDMWGVRRRESPTGGGRVEQIFPFTEDSTIDDVARHPWPDPDRLDYSGIGPACQRHRGEFVVYGAPWSPFFHEAGWILGQENLLVWMAERPEFVEAVLDRIVNYELEVCRRFFAAAGDALDIAFFGNDFGTQRGLLISPAMWERLIRPPLKRFYDLAHAHGLRVMQHSCGGIRPIIPWLIEDGLDILDPVQVVAEGMDLAGLVRDFGGRLSFHGGLDTQQVLPFGTEQEVRAAVRACREATRDRGGYILCGSQQFQGDVPPVNIVAMYDENTRIG